MRATRLWLMFAVLAWGLVSTSFAERKELQPPKPLTFDPRQHMKSNYREAIDLLCAGDEPRPPSVVTLCRSLGGTLNQDALLQAFKVALGELQSEQRWAEQAQKLKESVVRGDYVLTVPVEFRVLEAGGWEILWRTWDDTTWSWSGPYEVRKISPVSKPHCVVEARIVSENSSVRFGYNVRNRSDQLITKLLLDPVGLTRTRIKLVNEARGRLYGRREVAGLGYVIMTPKEGAVQRLFSFWAWDPTIRDRDGGRPALPGQTLSLPPLFGVPWPSLPGVIRCWVDPREWSGPRGISAEDDPPDVAEMIYSGAWEDTPLGPNKLPRWAAHGKTIGPVPTPDQGTPRGKWVDQLVAWHAEARKWGWYGKGGEKLWETHAADLKADPSDQRIRDLLAKAEEDHEAGRLLEETYALWHYNLEYLLKMPQ